MLLFIGIAGMALIAVVLWDSFETIILPRRVARRIRITSLFYRLTWRPFSALARLIRRPKRRESYLGYYGPLSTLVLLSVWASGLILAFAMLQWSIGSRVQSPERFPDFWTDLYMSGTTFFTLGLGDVTPATAAARALTTLEGGLGIGFLAVIVGYFPVLYQAFSRREASISLLDSRAGSPSTAGQLLSHYANARDRAGLEQFLHEWERWTADLLESHISYPVLSLFRSQHDNQSWLAAVTTVLDACALILAGVRGGPRSQAELTFAMARHAVVDISQVLRQRPAPPRPDRLSPAELKRLREHLTAAGVALDDDPLVESSLTELRAMYEPYVNALSRFLAMPLPPWTAGNRVVHNWQTTAWSRQAAPHDLEDDHLAL